MADADRSDSRLIVKLNQKWFNQKISTNVTDVKRLPRDQELALKREAEELLASDVQMYKKSLDKGRKSEFEWIWKVLHNGALADKLSANSLLNQDSAVHNLTSLKAMLQLCQSKGKREFLLASEHLKELLLADILPPFKLTHFGESVVGVPSSGRERSIHLILSYYEDQLKFLYKEFIDTIEKLSHDAVVATKNKSIYMLYELLSNKPEQEQLLLSHLANKLGDPCPKAAAHALHLLNKLVVQDHPAMKEVVVKEVERVLFRANIKERAQYRCLCLFQGLRLSLSDQSLANRLMEIYFSFFTKCVKSGDVNNKTMSVILSGVTRALPYSSMGKAAVKKHMDTFYKLVYLVNTGIAIQVFVLVLQVVSAPANRRHNSDESEKLTDRFLSSLYRFLLKQDLFDSSSRMPMFFNLLFKALKFDKQACRMYAFVKRLLQISCHASPPVASAVIYLVSELLKNKKHLSLLFHAERENTMQAADESPQSPGDTKREKKRKGLRQHVLKGAGKITEPAALKESGTSVGQVEYQVNARNPLFAHSENTSSWEMRFLTCHYHPSVCSFAQSITSRKFIDYDGDPLQDFSLKHFLDRFVRKKPKVQHDADDDNDSVNSDEFEEILRKNETNLQGDDDDVEWDDLTDEECKDGDDDDLFDDDEVEDLFDSDDDLSEGGFSDAFDEEDHHMGSDSLFAPAEDVEEDEDGNFVFRKEKNSVKTNEKKRVKNQAKLPVGKRLRKT